MIAIILSSFFWRSKQLFKQLIEYRCEYFWKFSEVAIYHEARLPIGTSVFQYLLFECDNLFNEFRETAFYENHKNTLYKFCKTKSKCKITIFVLNHFILTQHVQRTSNATD